MQNPRSENGCSGSCFSNWELRRFDRFCFRWFNLVRKNFNDEVARSYTHLHSLLWSGDWVLLWDHNALLSIQFLYWAKLCWHQSSTSNAILSNLVFSFSHLTRFCTLAYDDLRYLLSFSLFFCTVIYYQRFTILTKKWGCCWTNPQKNFTILSNFVLGFSDFNFNSFAFDPYPKVLVSICVT